MAGRAEYSFGRWRRVLKIAAVNVGAILLLFEVGSVAAYFIAEKEFFYVRNEAREKAAIEKLKTDLQLTPQLGALRSQLHPYFGYIHLPGIEFSADSQRANNCGFRSPYDYPFKKTNDRQFVVAVIGGSVASGYALWEGEKRPVLAKAIQSVPGFENREVVILNLANGGYKEPQPLLVLSYFLSVGQEFDAVINIGGFNDIAFAHMNNRSGVDLSMPNALVASPLIDLANQQASPDLSLMLEIVMTKAKLRHALNRITACTFATCYAFRKLQVKYLSYRYRNKVMALSEAQRTQQGAHSLVFFPRVKQPLPDAEAYEQIIEIWARSSRAIADLLAARKIRYFQFVQPNQYYKTARVFGEAEKRVAIQEGNELQISVPAGYPKLLARMEILQTSGVKVFSAVNIFDDFPQIAYSDACCHYSPEGYAAFQDFVARTLATNWDR